MRPIYSMIVVSLFALALAPAAADPSGMVPSGASASRVRVNAMDVSVREDASSDSERIAKVDKDRVLDVVARSGAWVQVALSGGRKGWVSEQFVSPLAGAQPAKAPTGLPPVAWAAGPGQKPAAPAPTQPAAAQVQPAAQAQPAPAQPQPAAKSPQAAPTQDAPSFLDDAQPDPAERPKDSPASTLVGAIRMALCLVPVLALIVLAVRGLKLVQQRVGVAPISRKNIIGGLIEMKARSTGGSSIRVVESVPVGGVSLHLVEVRGKVLLLGATAGSVSMLSEFEPAKVLPEDEFRAIMERARADMFGPDPAPANGIAGAVGALDENLRKAREAIARGVARAKAS